MHNEPHWQFEVFGHFQLIDPAGTVFATRSDRALVLLAHLALKPELSASRTSVESILFDDDLGRSAPNLALLLTRLQSSLKKGGFDSPLLVKGGTLQLHRSRVHCDAQLFESLVNKAKTQYDPLAKGSTLVEALNVVKGRPVPELDHPLLTLERQRLEKLVFAVLADVASGPLGPQNQDLILNILDSLDDECYTDPLLFESILLIYGGLGLKENLVSAFTRYEGALYDEFGETPRSQITSLFNELITKLDSDPGHQAISAPPRPKAIIGRDEEIQLLTDYVRHKLHPVVTVVGQSGIGKSHLLRALYWMIPGESCTFIDLESISPSAVVELLKDGKHDAVFLDHYRPEAISLITQLRQKYPNTIILIAGSAATKLPGESLLLLSPMGAGTPDAPGASAEVILSQFAAIKSGANLPDIEKVIELADLCNGLPLALEVAGRLAATIGIDGTIGGLRRNPFGLHAGSGSPDRHRSLDQAILSSFIHLQPGAKRAVHVLSLLGQSCHVDLLLSAARIAPDELEEAILSGLVRVEKDRPVVSLMRLTQEVILAHESELGLDPNALLSFYRNSVDWISASAGNRAKAIGIAYCLPLALSISKGLVVLGDRVRGVVLFSQLRPWFGSHKVSDSELLECMGFFRERGAESRSEWMKCMLTLGAALFHAALLNEMRQTAEIVIASDDFPHCLPSEQCHMEMQLALALRGLRYYDDALEGYRRVLTKAREIGEDGIVVTVCYNLGSLLEVQGKFEEAHRFYDEGTKYVDESTDPRLESSLHLALGRSLLHLEVDPREAEMILEAALFHARGRKDERMINELVSCLAHAYLKLERFEEAGAASVSAAAMRWQRESRLEFMRHAKGGFLTQCLCWMELGFEDLAILARVFSDRIGGDEAAGIWAAIAKRVQDRTYVTPPSLRQRPLSEEEFRSYFQTAFATLIERFGDQPKVVSLLNYGLASDSAWSKTMKSVPNWSWKTSRPSSVASHSHS